MKKAVITTGSKQYLVSEGQVLDVELLKTDDKMVHFDALLLIEEAGTQVGTPVLKGKKVTAEIVEPIIKSEKVSGVRFKAKKRVHKVHGHRQRMTTIKVVSIA